jgi:dihydroorotate dehydrogenase (NAD+) catalytic subunit
LGTAVDVDSGFPVLGGVLGGLSGPAIHPIALRAVYQIRQAVRIPIIGVGGIEDWKGALQMIMAGASAVQIGSAVTSKGLDVFREVTTGIGKFLEQKGFRSIREIVSLAAAHKVEGS